MSPGRTAPDAPTVGLLRAAIVAVTFVAIVEAMFRPPLPLFLFGAANGSLYGLAAVGVVLVHRTHRIINFAAIALGALPAVAAALLVAFHGLSYWPALGLAVLGGAALGAVTEITVVRRFSRSPRLILTIATLAVVQLIALAHEPIAARLVSDRSVPSRVDTPWSRITWLDARGSPILDGDHIAAVVALLLVGTGLALLLRFTRSGIALRAAAENIDRAHLLGIPVDRLHTLAWAIAGLVAGVTVFFRIPLVGVPLDPTLGWQATLFVIAAAAVARFESITTAVAAGVGIGVLEQASVAKIGSADLTSALMLGLVLVALLLRRPDAGRGALLERDSWQAVAEPRVVPIRVRRLPAVWIGRRMVAVLVVAVAVAAPYVLTSGQLAKLTLIPLTAVVAVSLVVLTGWAGQVSLGQFAFAGVGGGLAGGLAANHGVDFFVALGAGVVAGAVAGVLVGLPSVRVRGLYLAVTTLALAATMEFYVLQRDYPIHRLVLPHGEAPRVERPALYGVIDLANDRTFYFASLVFLVVAVALARSFRHSRTGRVVLAARDNPVAATAYGVNVAGARLAAFALAGALAAMGGVLLVYQQGAVDPGTYGVTPSLQLFLLTVLGGITSPMGAVLGATVLKSVQFFVEPHLQSASLLFEGPLLLVVLLRNPRGLSAAVERVRDRWLAAVSARHAPPLEPPEPRASGEELLAVGAATGTSS